MKQERIYYRRLKKLENHLRNGKLGHKKFDFSSVHDGNPTKNHCGTAGCAMGECPVIFPKDWRFSTEIESDADAWGFVCLKETKNGKYIGTYDGFQVAINSSMKFFGVSRNEAEHLFVPTEQKLIYGGDRLEDNATKIQVANNIKSFLNTRYKGPKR